MSDHTIKQALAAKAEAEDAIHKILTSFMEQYQMTVAGVELETINSASLISRYDDKILTSVRLKVIL